MHGPVLAALLLASSLAPAAAPDAVAALKRIDASVNAQWPRLEALYRDLHAHPELAFEEVRTAATLAKEMREAGFTVTEGVGRTGLVAMFANGSGPLVMVRTDLDGLPMEDQTGLPYASRARAQYNGAETFVAHSCGHDIHMSVWVGTARALVAMKDRWRGTLMFIAQPAEERVSGAKAMLEDGLFSRFGKPDAGFGLHVMPGAFDEVQWRTGAMTSNGTSLTVRFTGRGGHGSDPSATIDPVMMASRFVVDLQSVVSREKDPTAFGVVSIGAIHGGSAGNIIPDSVTLQGTVRSTSDVVHEKLEDGVRRTANAVAAMAGAPAPEVQLRGGVKSVINDEQVTARAAAMLTAGLGAKARIAPAAWTAGEDFTEFVNAGVPSFYFGLGAYDPVQYAQAIASGTPLPANHSPGFAPAPDPTIRTGIRAMSLAVLSALETR
jgi:hippurate hydrolase